MEDLRVYKTKKSIRETFLNIRRVKPLEKIKVNEICEQAMINRATFYRYYQDVFNLNEKLEQQALLQLLENFDAREELLSDTERFLKEFPKAMEKSREILDVLYHDRMEELFYRLEDYMLKTYTKEEADGQKKLLMSFIIRGVMYSLKDIPLDEDAQKDLYASCIVKYIAALKPLLME